MTGTEDALDSAAISEWGPTRATIHDTIDEITLAVSKSDSLTYSGLSIKSVRNATGKTNPQLNIILPKEHWVTTEMNHGCLGRHSGPG